MKKIVTVLIDGIGDLSHSIFNYRTPLQIAHTPFLDALAGINLLLLRILYFFPLCKECGVCGLMDSFEPGYACGSDTAHMMIFGYKARGFELSFF